MSQFLLSVTVCLIHLLFVVNGNDELEIDVLHKPEQCERPAKRGDLISMNYRGTLEDGTEFDSSYERKEPFQFQLGIGQVIKGWDQGLLEICIGEKRRLTIPPHLGYGDTGAGDKIPAKSTLIFEVECVDIKDGPAPANLFKEIDTDDDKQLSRDEINGYLEKQMPKVEAENIPDMPEREKLVEDIFQHEDKDKDGFISHDEFSGPKHDEL